MTPLSAQSLFEESATALEPVRLERCAARARMRCLSVFSREPDRALCCELPQPDSPIARTIGMRRDAAQPCGYRSCGNSSLLPDHQGSHGIWLEFLHREQTASMSENRCPMHELAPRPYRRTWNRPASLLVPCRITPFEASGHGQFCVLLLPEYRDNARPAYITLWLNDHCYNSRERCSCACW